MTNIPRGGRSVKPSDAAAPGSPSSPVVGTPSSPVVGTPSSPVSGTSASPGREALEISRLLVEVLQIGQHGGRHGSADLSGMEAAQAAVIAASAPSSAGVGPGGTGSPVASHVIRAAIHIYAHGPRTISELANGLGISQGWASRIVDEMERAGYVERERDATDRRVVRVRLAPKAVARVEMVYSWRGDAVEAALDGMSTTERGAVNEFLRRFVEAAQAAR